MQDQPGFLEELKQRPALSFRVEIVLGFMIFFVLAVAITLGAMFMLNRVQHRFAAVQTWERFLFHVEQARRWEKNFFLYGTNLPEALNNAEEAARLVEQDPASLEEIASVQHREQIQESLLIYSALLADLAKRKETGAIDAIAFEEIEAGLREHGGIIVRQAIELTEKEHALINRWMHLLQKIPLYFLAFLFLASAFTALYLSQRLMKPLNRLVEYTGHIARGDFDRIKPISKFRDEFSSVEVAINRMLRDLEARQASLIESHKLQAVGVLTAGVAHELNNPLNNIMLTAHTMLEEHGDMTLEDELEMIRDIIQETERSRSIVRNLLDYTRESKSVMEPLDLDELLKSTVKLSANQARMAGARINLDIADGLPHIQGDRQQLKQAFLNLILNSLDALQPGGQVDISAKKASEEGFLEITVRDNGCGIPKDIQSQIFDPFFTTKPFGKGTGLGLKVCLGIIIKHGGRIDVASEPGQFTRFTITMPYDTPYTGDRHRLVDSQNTT